MWRDPLDQLPRSARIGTVKQNLKGLGCLVLFATPFAAAGLFVGFLALKMLWLWVEVREWQEVPAQIVQTDLITSTGDDSNTYRVEATYHYEFGGVAHQGDRVGLSTGSDNIGSFHQDVYRQLADHQATGKPFRCYVNPQEPTDALLYRELRWGLFALMGVFGLVFSGVGIGLMVGAGVVKRRSEDEEQLSGTHPEEPWRWKGEWTEGRITATGKAQFLLPCIMAVLWNLVSAPLLFLVPQEVRDNDNYLALLGLIFPVVGVGLAVWAIRSFIRWRKFGDSVLELSAFPGVIGGALKGRILTSVNIKATHGFRLTLNCIQQVTRGSGDNRRTSESILWQQETRLQRESAEFDPSRSEIPIEFQIPFDASPTEERSDDDKTLWRLEATAEVSGVDYAAQFEVPVFRTAESRDEAQLETEPDAWGTEPEPALDLAQYGIHSELLSTGGQRLTFRAARHKGPALGLTAFLILWLGFNYLLVRLDAPIFFPILWGVFSVLIFLGVLDLWFERRTLEVHSDRLVLAGGIFGIGRSRVIPTDQIQEAIPIRGMQSGNKLFYRIQIRTHEDKTYIAATKLDNLSLAHAILEKLN